MLFEPVLCCFQRSLDCGDLKIISLELCQGSFIALPSGFSSLRRGVDIRKKTAKGRSPLHSAARYGAVHSMKILLSQLCLQKTVRTCV